jgi:aspartate carbamoyltransferase catalytic subunit
MSEVRHLVSAADLDLHALNNLLQASATLMSPRAKTFARNTVRQETDSTTMIYSFVEPSTRTRMSFITAAELLGMTVQGTENAKVSSSAAKRESLEDGITTLNQYAKKFGHAAIVLRDSEPGAAQRAAAVSEVPIINAGDGEGEHPTQGILDKLTEYLRRGRQLGNQVHFYVGDGKNSRTIHSKVQLDLLFPGNEFIFATPKGLEIDEKTRGRLEEAGAPYLEVNSLLEGLEETEGKARDFYFTRDQEERRQAAINKAFKNLNVLRGVKLTIEDRRIKKDFMRDCILTPEILDREITEDDAIYHPRPQVGEISALENDDPRNESINQMSDGVEARMAVLMWAMRIGLFKNGDIIKTIPLD